MEWPRDNSVLKSCARSGAGLQRSLGEAPEEGSDALLYQVVGSAPTHLFSLPSEGYQMSCLWPLSCPWARGSPSPGKRKMKLTTRHPPSSLESPESARVSHWDFIVLLKKKPTYFLSPPQFRLPFLWMQILGHPLEVLLKILNFKTLKTSRILEILRTRSEHKCTLHKSVKYKQYYQSKHVHVEKLENKSLENLKSPVVLQPE